MRSARVMAKISRSAAAYLVKKTLTKCENRPPSPWYSGERGAKSPHIFGDFLNFATCVDSPSEARQLSAMRGAVLHVPADDQGGDQAA